MFPLSDFFVTAFSKLPVSKVIFLVKIGLMGTGIYKFIESFYVYFGNLQDINFETFVIYHIVVIAIIFVASIISFYICSYLYKKFKVEFNL